MNDVARLIGKVTFMMAVAVMLFPVPSRADNGQKYCVTPPFINASIPPNVLLMIDNSSSMFDLAYSDTGKLGTCSTATTTTCLSNAGCPSGQTCISGRDPYYCYDETYATATSYVGYFDPATYYYYRSGTDDFAPVTSPFPSGCGTHASTTTKTNTQNTLCVEYMADSTRALVSFVARGDYLNWLTSSKFDVEKQILTGGKYDGSSLIPESRGCVGQGYIKDAITGNFVNYAAPATNNTNTQLAVTFSVHGPLNPNDITAPSVGGQTYIDLFASNRKYDYGSCQTAVDTLASTTSSNADVKQSVATCLAGSSSGYCQNNIGINCFSTYPDCYVPGHCSGTATACLANNDCTTLPKTCVFGYYCEATDGTLTNISCPTPGPNSPSCPSASLLCNEIIPPATTASVAPSIACTTAGSTAAPCDIPATYWCDWGATWMSTAHASSPNGSGSGYTCDGIMTADPACGVQSTQQGKCSLKPQTSCNVDTDCSAHGNGVCIGYKSNGNHNCILHTAEVNHGTCQWINGATNGVCGGQKDYGECIFGGAADISTKTKVNFQQAMQACWQYNRFVHGVNGGADIGIDDLKTLDKQCSDIYNGSGSTAPYKTCSNDHTRTCTVATVATDCGAANTCTDGPNAIAPGYPALICGANYEGAAYYKSAYNVWVKKGSLNDSTTPFSSIRTDTGVLVTTPLGCLTTDTLPACMKKIYQGFCNANQAPPVTDPTNAPSDTASYDNLPAILSGIGVEAQLGAPIKTMRAKVAAATAPTGLIQEFSSKIRLGAMNFNFNGSQTEAASLLQQRVCSNNHAMPCSMDVDCPGSTCLSLVDSAAYNLDGAQVIYRVGQGHCSTNPATLCTTDAHCTGANNKCTIDSVGDHTTSGTLVNTLDGIRANAWTPFAEAYYNAIGYFAAVGTCSNSSTSCTLDSQCSGGSCLFQSRTTLRINPGDFDETKNPSQYRCQSNYVLLISDGSSTADRNTSASNLSGLYSQMAGKPAGWDSTCPSYMGSKNLPIMSWIAHNRNIATFSLSGTPTATVCSNDASVVCSNDSTCGPGHTCLNLPRNTRDTIGTYVVFNGASNGVTGECNSLQLLTDTATNGGSTIQPATDPSQLSAALRTVFEQLSAKASSGTAASILSNSEGSGANILQAVFYPKKTFDSGATDVNWVGELQNLWYYIDPFIGHSSVREDTDYTATNLAANADHHLNLRTDKVVQFNFNTTTLETQASLYPDLDGDGAADSVTPTTVSADAVNSLWRAGKLLWARSPSDRTIYTNTTVYNPAGNASSTPALFTGLDTSDATGMANRTLLNAASQAEANNIINFTAGVDYTGYRNRTIATTTGGTQHVWKLGDIISSTPRVESAVPLNNYHQPPTGGYNDTTYAAYIATLAPTGYKGRGMAYVAANDGMLHAFRMGSLDVSASGDLKATLSGTDLGKEEWAFIPKNVLPYLKYSADVDYPHIYTMDGATALLDASIACAVSDYSNCTKTVNSWRTLLIGGMGIGGATRNTDDTCTELAGGTCVKTPVSGVGYSSYYALDVTTPASPSLLWEFSGDFTVVGSPKYLGYATSGPATVRIGATPDKHCSVTTATACSSDANCPTGETCAPTNGHWFAVFASGPTGPIDGCNFRGTSNQNLYLFVVDLKTGALVRTIDTGIANAFGGTIGNGTIDTDRWNKTGSGFYQDNAVYIGYTKRRGSGTAADPYTWTDGGVLRLLTKENPSPSNWTVYPLIDGIGPVITSVAKIQDRKNHNLWLYFGTGRYFCSLDDMDTSDPPRRLFGVKDPCYQRETSPGVVPYPETLAPDCTDSLGTGVGSLTDKTSDPSDSLSITGSHGWYKSLEAANYPLTGFGAERMISDPVAMTNGVIFMTSFKPTADICEFGGKSYMWATKYDTGGLPMCSSIEGKALVQVSTGAFIEVSLKDVIGCRNPDGTLHPPVTPPPAWADPDPPGYTRPPDKGPGMIGKPPQEPPPIITKSNLKPIKKVLHIRER